MLDHFSYQKSLKPVGNPYVVAIVWHCTELCFRRGFV